MLGLSVLVALVFGIFWTHERIINTIQNSTRYVESHERLLFTGQAILLEVLKLNREEDADRSRLQKLTTSFDQTRREIGQLARQGADTPLERQHWKPAVDQQLSKFSQLAGQAHRAEALVPTAIAEHMQSLYEANIAGNVQRANARLRAATDETTDQLQGRKLFLGSVALLVLALECAIVFLPIHRTVQHALKDLRRQTVVLTASQRELKQVNERLLGLVNHDQLTNLPNRAFANTHLLETIGQHPSLETGVLFLGLDGFKAVNEMLGHENADQFLIAVAERLTACVDEDDLVARVGGDEFILTTKEPPEELVKRIFSTLAEPFVIDNRTVNANASIGFLSAYENNHRPEEILANAGLAMQAAKTEGGRKAVAYSASLREQSAQSRQMQLDLRDAITNGELEPWFQPQLRLSDGTLRGAEVLARWRHPTKGLMTPDQFLPAAAQAGLTIELDHAIWKTAAAAAKRWRDAGSLGLTVALNASPETISDPYLLEKLLKLLHAHDLDTSEVAIEVLETTLIENSDDMAAINIDSLAECGVCVELDDFGTGYSSLSKLTQLPLTSIKLDRALVAPLPEQAALSVIRAILAMTRELGLEVIAEGIEDEAQAHLLTQHGCEFGQGYSFGRPMPLADFEAWLQHEAKLRPIASGVTQFPMQA